MLWNDNLRDDVWVDFGNFKAVGFDKTARSKSGQNTSSQARSQMGSHCTRVSKLESGAYLVEPKTTGGQLERLWLVVAGRKRTVIMRRANVAPGCVLLTSQAKGVGVGVGVDGVECCLYQTDKLWLVRVTWGLLE